MSKEVIIFAIVLPTIILMWSGLLIYLYKDAEKINTEIEAVKKLAKDAKTLDEVVTAYDQLLIVGKKCWHRNDIAKLNVILAILQTKHEIICQEK